MIKKKQVMATIVILGFGFLSGCTSQARQDGRQDKQMMDEPGDPGAAKMQAANEKETPKGMGAPLAEYSRQRYEKAASSEKLVVLNFHANWCPVCKNEVEELRKAAAELDPEKVEILMVSYKDNEATDEEEALAREYGVAYQHTKVFLKNGERILKSPEAWKKERFIEEISGAAG